MTTTPNPPFTPSSSTNTTPFNADAHFTLANIPFGIASRIGTKINEKPQVATRLYGYVYFMPELLEMGVLRGLDGEVVDALRCPTLNALASLPRSSVTLLRKALQSLLASTLSDSDSDSPTVSNSNQNPHPDLPTLQKCRAPLSTVHMHLPLQIPDFSDFSCSRNHVLNASAAVMGKASVPPGFEGFPVGYAGRCSSIRVSQFGQSGVSGSGVGEGGVGVVGEGNEGEGEGESGGNRGGGGKASTSGDGGKGRSGGIKRPWGQYWVAEEGGSKKVVFGESKMVDFELEVGCIIGSGSGSTTTDGRGGNSPVKIEDALDRVFGFVLVNDWSSRDIQALEMNPLGPFNGKSFATTVSPWIVTVDALEPFRIPVPKRDSLAPYLTGDKYSYAMTLTAEVISHGVAVNVCRSKLDDLYWTFEDMIAHHTVNGCELRTGDLLATGTVSGENPGQFGCLLEITKGGKEKVVLEGIGERTYLEDGDGVRLLGWAGEMGSESCVGFGGCEGFIEAAGKWK